MGKKKGGKKSEITAPRTAPHPMPGVMEDAAPVATASGSSASGPIPKPDVGLGEKGQGDVGPRGRGRGRAKIAGAAAAPGGIVSPFPGGPSSQQGRPKEKWERGFQMPPSPYQGGPQQGGPQQGGSNQGALQQGGPQQGALQQGGPQQGGPKQKWERGFQQPPSPYQGGPQQGGSQQGGPQQGGLWQKGPQQPGGSDHGSPLKQGGPWQKGPQQPGGSDHGSPLKRGGPRQSGPQQRESLSSRPPPREASVEPAFVESPPKLISVNKGLSDMSIAKPSSPSGQAPFLQIPRRKTRTSCGSLGRRIQVETNHLALDLSRMVKKVYHYDVDIQPDRPKRLIRPALFAFQHKFFPGCSPPFDGKKNLFSAAPLPFGQSKCDDVKVRDPERERDMEFKVTLKQVNVIDMESLISFMHGGTQPIPQLAITALDIILRCAPARGMVPVGRSYFTPPAGAVHSLGDGMEVWLGIFQSAIIGWKPFVNIDVAHKGFPKVQNCIDLIDDLFERREDPNTELQSYSKDDLLKYIRELKVIYEIPGQPHTKRTYRVNGLGKSARTQMFKTDDGKQTSVELYYKMVKRCDLRFPHMPCLDVGSPKRETKILVPLELCQVMGGQVVVKKMTEKQTTNLIRIAATNTDIRRSKIMDAIRKVDFSHDPSIQEFGLRVNDQFEKVNARILDPPTLQYKEARPVLPNKGVWRNGTFLDGKSLQRWTILSMARNVRDEQLRTFAQMLKSQGAQMGMQVAEPQQPINTVILHNETAKLEAFCRQNKELQLIFVVVMDSGFSYAKIKQVSELTVGVLTQCLKSRTLQRMNPATCGNILLKVNAKLNGTNHLFADSVRPWVLDTPCMIVGADVTHPPPDENNRPSVAAVCASNDPKAFKYNLQYRLQPARQEIILDLEAIMKSQLMFFYKTSKQKPQRIIFYRDGVSEGQFQDVLNKEFQAIRRACKSLAENYEPKVTFLVVQKRHHTRFFPEAKDADGRNKNVPAGTIVDTIITHPTDLDFYLVSHASIQGVSRPTKYRRLWDDSDLSEDDLELLTYYLCHMFTRCTRSVSYPAPTYYAHLAAYRARCYLDGGAPVNINKLEQEQNSRVIRAEIISGNPMFFV